MLDYVASAEVEVPEDGMPADLIAVDVADILDCEPGQVQVAFGSDAHVRVTMASGDSGSCYLVDDALTTDTSFLDGVARTALASLLGR